MATSDGDDALAETVRNEGSRILATLVRTVGDLALAEDAVQDACLAALRTWPVTGIPPQPRAWLTLAARRRAIDVLRRERSRPGRETDAARLAALASTDVPSDDVVRETCCAWSSPAATPRCRRRRRSPWRCGRCADSRRRASRRSC